jgi:hypothetical protein
MPIACLSVLTGWVRPVIRIVPGIRDMNRDTRLVRGTDVPYHITRLWKATPHHQQQQQQDRASGDRHGSVPPCQHEAGSVSAEDRRDGHPARLPRGRGRLWPAAAWLAGA